jgi:hypothetical protein
VNDPAEAEKVRSQSSWIDVHVAQLQGAWDSNELPPGCRDQRRPEKPMQSQQFDKHLMAEIAERRATAVKQVFSYALFRPMSIDRLISGSSATFRARRCCWRPA